MHTILGAGGAIGMDLAKELKKMNKNVRLVNRNPQKVSETDELFPADLLNKSQTAAALKGTDVAYLTAGLQYKTSVWKKDWPLLMENIIDACKQNASKLVFIDNIYLYDPDQLSHITEQTAVNPCSEKGKVRAEIVEKLLAAEQKGDLRSLIARAPDFYGPAIRNSMLLEIVFKNLLKGKRANWFCSVDFKHSFIYTPDAAKATAILGNDAKAFGQTWHLPTASNPWTGKEWIENFAQALGTKASYSVISKTMTRILGVFIPVLKESYEMLYQFDRDYIFDSSKFNTAYNFQPTSWFSGISNVVAEAK